MLVLDRRIGRAGALAVARHDDRDLAGEIDEALEDRNLAADLAPGGGKIGVGAEHDLSLAVIAEPHRLEHAVLADVDVAKLRHGPERRCAT